MSRDRTFFVRLNIDDLAANIAALDGHEEKGAWLDGFMVGSRGALPRESWWEPKRIGHAFGFECFQRAEIFRESQTDKAIKAVAAKAAKRAELTQSVPVGVPVGNPECTLANSQKPVTIRPETKSQQPAISRENFGQWAALYYPNFHAEALDWFDQQGALGWVLANGAPIKSPQHLFTNNLKAGKIIKKPKGLPFL